jgi:hypothetical protein
VKIIVINGKLAGDLRISNLTAQSEILCRAHLMKTAQLFRRKLKVALPEEDFKTLRADYLDAFSPCASSATRFFRAFTVNGQERYWLLPGVETYEDLAIHRIKYVMKYKKWFLKQVQKTPWPNDPAYQIPGAEVIL